MSTNETTGESGNRVEQKGEYEVRYGHPVKEVTMGPGVLEATDGSDGWTMHARELRAILSGDAGREGRVSPVLREETPFNGGEADD